MTDGGPALTCPACGCTGMFFVDTEPHCGTDRPCSIECLECCTRWTPSGAPVEHHPALIADAIRRRQAAEQAAQNHIPGQTEIELPPG